MTIDGDWLRRLAEATARYPFRVWGFGESIAIEALLAYQGKPGAYAATLLRNWAVAAPPLADDPLAHVTPGVPLLVLHARAAEEPLFLRARELAMVLEDARRGAHGARLHRPDLAGWQHEVWVDCMHLDGPFLALLGNAWSDLAADLLLTHARVLQDDRTGLFSHGFDDATGRANGIFWGRGQGWALLGLTDTLYHLPPGHAARAEVQQRLESLCQGLVDTTDAQGEWHTVVDQRATYVEPSVSAFVALGLGRACRRAQLAPVFGATADAAWAYVKTHIAQDGTLPGVSDATPVGADVDHYASRGIGVFAWGQGPAPLAAVERQEDRHA